MAGDTLLEIRGVSRSFGQYRALDGVDLAVGRGEFFSLLGPSGCGKTTLLRLIAGLDHPGQGSIILDGEDLTDRPAHRRPINMMFQSYALFPHMSVAGNIAFGLRQGGRAAPRGRALHDRVGEAMNMLRLEGLGSRRPAMLSGGQQQRVALARALVCNPKLLLLDEPLAALDKQLRRHTQFELKALQRRLGMTFIVVTHDQEEAMSLSDRIAVLDRGRIQQIARPQELYDTPVSRQVAEFIGDINLLAARVLARPAGGRLDVRLAGGQDCRLETSRSWEPGDSVLVGVRPEWCVLTGPQQGNGAPGGGGSGCLDARLSDISFLGHGAIVRLRLTCGTEINVAVPAGDRPVATEHSTVGVRFTRSVVFPS